MRWFFMLSLGFLTACGGGSSSDLEGGPAGFAPRLSVDGAVVSSQPVAISVEENSTLVASVSSSAGNLSLSADLDGALFEISAEGQLSFIDAPDFENPGGDGSNVYSVRIDTSAGDLSAAVTLTVSVTDVFEGVTISGRIIDGPVAGASVYVDLNCNNKQDEGEPSGVSDDSGFFALESQAVAAEGCAPKFVAVGGTDIATGEDLGNIVLRADVPADPTQPVAITPLTTIIAQAETDEAKHAVVAALGLGDTPVEDILTTDPWGTSDGTQTTNNDGTEVTEEDKAQAEAIQRVNAQVATLIKVAAEVASTAQDGEDEAADTLSAVEAVANSIVSKAEAAAAESLTTGLAVTVDISDAAIIQEVIEETVIEVVIVQAVAKAEAEASAAGATEEEIEAAKAEAETAAVVVAETKVAQVAAVTLAAASAVEIVNTAAADETVNPTSTEGVALAQATESTVVASVVAVVADVQAAIVIAIAEAGEDATEEEISAAVSAAAEAAAETSVVDNAVSAEDIQAEILEAAEEIDPGTVIEIEDLDNDGLSDLVDTDDDGDGVNDAVDAFPRDASETVDSDGDGIGDNADTDDDNDTVLDVDDDLPLNANETIDSDGDGIGNNADTDDDNDSVLDTDDAFPLDENESVDTDGDGTGNNADTDDDGDGVADTSDAFPLDNTETVDTDGDGTGNNADTDDDGDGVADTLDAFPLDDTESVDTDGDGTGNNADTDDDGDGVADTSDAFPLDDTETVDTDGDGTGNNADTDDDGDGVADTLDAFPLDDTETVDTDGDGTGNNADTDDDGDGVADTSDAFPLDDTESVDTDGDGTGNNADTDDDGDGVADTSDAFPLDEDESVDTDGDGTGNNADTDDDGDGVADTSDAFPLDNTETVDTDGDGTGNNADTDDDGDGVADTSDVFPLDVTESVDTDSDGIGNNADTDDDNDSVLDADDAFPLDVTESVDTDSDGTGNNADMDDDGDGILDVNDVDALNPLVGIGFSLSRVGLLDFVDGIKPNVYGLSPALESKTLSMTLSENALDLSNIRNLLDGDPATGISPRLLLLMEKVPAAGASGTIDLSLSVLDGNDGTRDTGERQLSSSITANWLSDGINIELTVPSQVQTVTFADDGGTLTAPFANASADVLTLREEDGYGNYPATLEVRVLDFFDANTGDIDLSSYFEREGNYFLEVGIDQGGNDNLFYEGAAFDKIQAVVKVEDLSIVPVTGFDVAASLDDEGSSVALIKPISDSESVEIELYPLLYGTRLEFDLGPGESLEAATLAGLAEGTSTLAPSIEFTLGHIPFNESGSFMLTVTFTDGQDGTRDLGERQITASVDVDYTADGSSATMTLPSQSQAVTLTDDDAAVTLSFSNDNDRALVVTPAGAEYPAELAVRLIAFFNSNVPASVASTDWSTFFTAGDYHLKVAVDEVEGADESSVSNLLSYEGMPIRTVEGVIPVQ